MKGLSIVPLLAIALSACSENPIEEQGEDAIAELDRQIERDANSLEEAADEAVQALEAEIAVNWRMTALPLWKPAHQKTIAKKANRR